MIYINQNSDTSVIKKYREKSGIESIEIDKSSALEDKMFLEELYKKSNNDISKDNIKKIICYIDNVINKINSKDCLEICWNSDDGYLKSYPTDIIKCEEYGINASDWVKVDSSRNLVSVKINNIKNIIAFEYIYRELGYNLDTIESIIGDTGIVGFNSSDKLIDRIKDMSSMYNKAVNLKIESTPYLNINNGKMISYFGNMIKNKHKQDDTYYRVITTSCKEIMSLIASTVMLNIDRSLKKVKLVSVSEDEFTFLYNKDVNIYDVLETVVIRSFGRQFTLKMEVTEL